NGLAGNKIWYIDEDNEGNMWFACFGAGVSKFDGEKFISYAKEDGLVDNSVRIVKYCSQTKCIAIGTNRSISVLKDSVFFNFNTKNNDLEKNVIITGILEKDSVVYFYDFANNHYYIQFDKGKPNIHRVEDNLTDNIGVSSLFEDENGRIYFGWNRKGIAEYFDTTLNKIDGIGQVFGIAKDYSQNIWAASWNGGGISPPGGLFKINEDSIFRLSQAYNINSVLGWAMKFDEEQKNLYYGTLDEGLYIIPPQYFEYYPSDYFGENDLFLNGIKIDNENNSWFYSDSSFFKFNGESFVKKDIEYLFNLRIQAEKDKVSDINLNTRIKRLKNAFHKRRTYIIDIELDNNNNAWLTCSNFGSFKIPGRIIKNSYYFAPYIYADIAFTNSDTLFQCDSWASALKKFDDYENSNKLVQYTDTTNPIFSKFIRSHKNEVWASSRISGFFLYKDGEFINLTKRDSTINKNVKDICFDEDGFAYVGGSDGRIELFDTIRRTKIYEIILPGLKNSIIWMNISNDLLFAGYSDGLRVFNIAEIKKKIINYRYFSTTEGYDVKIVNASAVDTIGNIWLATNNGLVKINTKLFSSCKLSPLTTVIKEVEIFNKKVNWREYTNIDNWSGLPIDDLLLSPEENHLSIYFHTLNFINPESDQYYYKLDGIDKDWVGPTDKKNVVYPFLNYGKYKFLVKSKNKVSGLHSNVAEFSFEILTPWYKQTWFYTVALISLILLVFVAYKIRINWLKRAEEEKRKIMQQISELEIKALQAQMNPHFLFNSINSIQNYMLDNELDKALGYLSSFSKVIRMTLEFVDKKFVRLSDVLTYLQHYVDLEKMRFDDMFEYEVKLSKNIDPNSILIPPMLLQPLIENSIKHGIQPLKVKGKIILEIEKINENSIKCIIEDNGIGRKKSLAQNEKRKLKKESKGIKITQERLDLLNENNTGDYSIKIIDLYDNGEPLGTRVEVTMVSVLN
ncbi:MAG: hypothetical protein C0598_13865, partial [Marinilabiliales bacterium]